MSRLHAQSKSSLYFRYFSLSLRLCVFDCAVSTLTATVLLHFSDWFVVAPDCNRLLTSTLRQHREGRFKCAKYKLYSACKSQGNINHCLVMGKPHVCVTTIKDNHTCSLAVGKVWEMVWWMTLLYPGLIPSVFSTAEIQLSPDMCSWCAMMGTDFSVNFSAVTQYC